jgi:hypothetical protein
MHSDAVGHLDRLVAAESDAGSPIAGYLRPGLSRVEVQSRMEAQDIDPPQELVDLYVWHDGVDQEAWSASGGQPAVLEFARYVFFPPMEEALLERSRIIAAAAELDRQLRASNLPRDVDFWRSEWHPVFVFDVAHYAVDCGHEHRGAIWMVELPPSEREIVYPSLFDMAETLARECTSGRAQWTAQSGWLLDRRR